MGAFRGQLDAAQFHQVRRGESNRSLVGEEAADAVHYRSGTNNDIVKGERGYTGKNIDYRFCGRAFRQREQRIAMGRCLQQYRTPHDRWAGIIHFDREKDKMPLTKPLTC